jgi:hypothetical protein
MRRSRRAATELAREKKKKQFAGVEHIGHVANVNKNLVSARKSCELGIAEAEKNAAGPPRQGRGGPEEKPPPRCRLGCF